MLEFIRAAFIRLSGSRLFQHLLFWTASFLFLANYFAGPGGIKRIDLIYAGLFHISLIAAVYLNIWLIVPVLLQKGRYLLFFLAEALLILLASLFNQLSFDHLVDLVLPGFFFISYYAFSDILKFVFVYVALSGLLKLSKGWFQLMRTQQQLMLAQQEKTETELKALKSQINPHFLFNSLNNIYSLALTGSPKSPEAILKLSDLMRYMLYESNEMNVALSREIKFMDNYIELQKLRSDTRSRIEYIKKGNLRGLKIAPLIFLPFIENAFKHGIKGSPAGGFVRIEFAAVDGNTELYVENNKGHVEKIEKDEYNGVGMSNVQRRLELIYPGRYGLDISDQKDTFSVRLKIQLG